MSFILAGVCGMLRHFGAVSKVNFFALLLMFERTVCVSRLPHRGSNPHTACKEKSLTRMQDFFLWQPLVEELRTLCYLNSLAINENIEPKATNT